jgi:glutamyl-tRNA synthetase
MVNECSPGDAQRRHDLSPFNAWVVLKGMETLGIRMQAQSAARWHWRSGWSSSPQVARVYYPGLASHPQHALAMRQQSGMGGAVLSFDVRRRSEQAARARFHVLDSTRSIGLCTNLGDTKTCITHPASTSHGRLTEAQRQAAGIGQGLIRLAVGLEHVDDMKADLHAGLDTLNDTRSKIRTRIRTVAPPASSTWATSARRCTPGRLRAPFRRRLHPAHRRHRRGALDPGRGGPDHRRHAWLGLDYDEGPFYQMQRMDRYKAVLAQMQAAGTSYPCYMPARPSWTRCARRRWRQAKSRATTAPGAPSPARRLPPVPEGVQPVLRFKNPRRRGVAWDDKVKGRIDHQQPRARRPGHRPARRHAHLQLLRGGGRHGHADHPCDPRRRPCQQHAAPDQHLPCAGRRAAGVRPPADRPQRAGREDEQAQRRQVRDAVPREPATCPTPWSTTWRAWAGATATTKCSAASSFWCSGSMDKHLGRSAAQFDEAKLRWVNAQHIKAMADDALAPLVAAQMRACADARHRDERLPRICALFKDRCDTTVALAQWACGFYATVCPARRARAQHVTDAVKPALALLADKLADCAWDKAAIAAAIKEVLAPGPEDAATGHAGARAGAGHGQTPSLDAVLELFCAKLCRKA